MSFGKILNSLDDSTEFYINTDVDSLYWMHHDMKEVLKGCGNKAKFEVDYCLNRRATISKSRFGVFYDKANSRMLLNGVKPKSVSLNLYPNMTLFRCRMDGFSCNLYLNVHFLGVDRISKENYFFRYQMFVLCHLLNQARCLAVKYQQKRSSSSPLVAQELESMHYFYCKSETNNDSSVHPRKLSTYVSADSLAIMATSFRDILREDAKKTLEEFKAAYSNKVLLGCNSKDAYMIDDETLAKMRVFLIKLSRSICFSATMAGFKDDFRRIPSLSHKFQFWSSDSEGMSLFNRQVQTMKTRSLEELMKKLFEIPDDMSAEEYVESLRLRFTYHFDFGIEITPTAVSKYSFLPKGKDCRSAAKALIKFQGHPSYTLNALLSPSFERLWEDDVSMRATAEDSEDSNSGNPHVLLESLEVQDSDVDTIQRGMSTESEESSENSLSSDSRLSNGRLNY